MALNLLTRATEGATLGLDAGRNVIVLSLCRNGAELDGPGFLGLLQGFVQTAERLRQELADLPDDEAAACRMAMPFNMLA